MHQHPLWEAWDCAVDAVISQVLAQRSAAAAAAAVIATSQTNAILPAPLLPLAPSPFFSEQLAAFNVWLNGGIVSEQAPPELPILLQVRFAAINIA